MDEFFVHYGDQDELHSAVEWNRNHVGDANRGMHERMITNDPGDEQYNNLLQMRAAMENMQSLHVPV